jgi:hypothetical protein
MELDWSAQSPHIHTLFRPWQPGDGYDEATLQEAEMRLGIRLPATLRTFYRAWGKRSDLADSAFFLLPPDRLVVRADTLLFWAENQESWYWGVPHEAMAEDDPPVVLTESGPTGWEVESKLYWMPSHPHLSSLLDDMAYLHAFRPGGAIHGGWTHPDLPDPSDRQIAWLEAHWSKAAVSPWTFGVVPYSTIYMRRPQSDDEVLYPFGPLYIRKGQAFHPFGGYTLAAHEAEALDELAQRFQITWAERW